MVLGELGSALAGALRKLGEHTVVDEEIMEACLKEVTKALTAADVNIAYVVQMKKNIVKSVNISELAARSKRQETPREGCVPRDLSHARGR